MEISKKIYAMQNIRRQIIENDMDFLALPISSWHAIGMAGFLREAFEYGRIQSGVIAICRHPVAGYVLEESVFLPLEKYNIKIVYVDSLPEDIQLDVRQIACKKKKKKEFYLLNAYMPNVAVAQYLQERLERHIVHVRIDEGLATYMRDLKGWMQEYQKGRNSNPLESVGYLLTSLKQRCFLKIYQEKGELLDANLFWQKRCGISKNQEAVKRYRDYYQAYAQFVELKDYSHYENAIVLCGQPYRETRDIRAEEDIRVLKDICMFFAKRKEKVIFKPHPRVTELERYQTLGCVIDTDNRWPLELVFAGLKTKPKAIIGITSTPLITAKLFWNIPTYTIYPMYRKTCVSKSLQNEMQNFYRIFHKYVKVWKE